MPDENAATGARAALKAAQLVLADAGRRKRLEQEGEPAKQALAELRLPEEALPGLLSLLNAIDLHGKPTKKPAKKPRDEMETMLLESFDHIRWSFWISLLMSTFVFLVGLVLLGVSVYLAVRAEGGMSWSALTVGGLGLADFAMLFYSRPWKDIATNLANSQQTRMIVTAYLSGYSLLPAEGPEKLAALKALTEDSVRMIQVYTEGERDDD